MASCRKHSSCSFATFFRCISFLSRVAARSLATAASFSATSIFTAASFSATSIFVAYCCSSESLTVLNVVLNRFSSSLIILARITLIFSICSFFNLSSISFSIVTIVEKSIADDSVGVKLLVSLSEDVKLLCERLEVAFFSPVFNARHNFFIPTSQ